MFRALISFVLLTTLITSCHLSERVKGSGNLIKEERTLDGFDGVQVAGGLNVLLVNGPNAVQVEGDDNILELVETEVRGGNLVVKFKDGYNVETSNSIKVRVSVQQLKNARVTGSGDIIGEGQMSSDDKVDLQVTGSGKITLELDAPEVDANVTGSGDIILSGSTRAIDCSTTGSGSIKAKDLKAEKAKARTSGSGDISVYGSEEIDAGITGSGNIRYAGGGKVSSKITGSGSVRPIE